MVTEDQDVPIWLHVGQEDIMSVLLPSGWLDVEVWTDKDGNEDPDGAGSFEATKGWFSFKTSDGEIVGPVSSILAVRHRV